MAKFLTDSDFAAIREVVNDTVETFAQKPVLYKLSADQALERFGRDRNRIDNKNVYNLLGLVVWNAPDAELKVEELGKYDFSMGYILFSWDYLDSEGLIVTGVDEKGNNTSKPVFIPEKDIVTVEGEDLEVYGVIVLGQLKDKESVVKVYFKRDLKNGQ